MPDWLKSFLSGLGSVLELIAGGSKRPPKRPRRVDVPDDIWKGSPAGRRPRRPGNGYSESGAETDGET